MLVGVAECLLPHSVTAESGRTEQLEPVVVTLPSRAKRPSSGEPGDATVGPLPPIALAREVQKELRRVGCYEGESSGIWTPSSRLAAQRFVDRVNARLPTDKPDEFLLGLLRDQSDGICGQCKRDETLDPSGRCMPTALISKAAPPRSIAADPASDSVRSDRTPAEQAQSLPDATVSRRPLRPADTATKSWSRIIKKVDRALGLY
jgi:hypothetical protein